MVLFANQFQSVVEWNETRDDVIFFKWQNNELKKDSRLIIRPGQDAIFLYNGRIEGIFEDPGSYDIESQIIPFLTTLKSFKFGFNTPLKAEVVFINTKEFLVKWGTKNPVNLKHPKLAGGMPIRCFGTFAFKVSDRDVFIEKIAGIRQTFFVDDVKERMISALNPLLMSWIAKEGHDMFNLQADGDSISKGIKGDLDYDLLKIGLTVTDFRIESFSYPEEIVRMQNKVAGQAMVDDVLKYQNVALADSMEKGTGDGMAANMAQMQMGFMMGQEMVKQMEQQKSEGKAPADGAYPNFCPNCGAKTTGSNFCGECGTKLR
ncbi:MAG: SPFH domain-containing protein [Erysipelotrichaceae bacterium]|nr:SPFH domain-containing protein [Erysipelotrichaceae bacterium]